MRKVIVGGVRYKRRTKKGLTNIVFARGKELGHGGEGAIYEGTATVMGPKGRKRTINVAFKYFKTSDDYALRNKIIPQQRIVQELQELERIHKRGLHILPTYRFVMEPGKQPFVVKTLLPPEKSLTREQQVQYHLDMKKQQKILESYGMFEEFDWLTFHPAILKDGTAIAVLNDMGNIGKPRSQPR